MTFWRDKPLAALSDAEWESLCDGCGKCCLHKLEDEDTGDIHYTDVACRLLDLTTSRCKRYPDRKRYVANCTVLTAGNIETFAWMPSSCAYRLLSEGKDLPDWHPLMTGDPMSTVKAGQSVAGRAVDERVAGDFEDHIVDWPE